MLNHLSSRSGTRRIRGLAISIICAVFAACGGGGDGPTPPGEKTCAEDPNQTKCQPTQTTTLKELATAKGRSIGVSVDAAFFATSSANYRSVVSREFNMIVAGNVMKWEPLNRNSRFAYRWDNPDAMVAFAQASGMKVRGHTLAWHQQNPAWLTGGTWSADTLLTLLKEHIDSVVGHYKGKVTAWDVVNEALNDGNGSLRVANSPWAGLLGASYIDSAFKEARAIDPQAQLFYNDYSLEFPGAKQDSAFVLVSRLKGQNVIDGIGFQGHFQINSDGSGIPSEASLTATFNRFANLGLKIHITELDIRIRDAASGSELTAQSQGYRTVVRACLAVTACEAIVVWGLNDGESWVPSTFAGYGRALLFTDAFGKKDTYNAVSAALSGQ